MSEPLEFHPLADIFPLMEGEEFDALVADIKANGLRESILLYEGKILDGRNRYRACLAAGWTPLAVDQMCEDDLGLIEDPAAYVISMNIHRRHLTAEQKRDVLVNLVAAQPEKADRVLAREAKVDHKQISRARRKAEATGAIAPVEKRTGADGKERKQPAKRGWSRERYKAHRALKRDPSVEVRGRVTEADGSRPKVAAEEISRFAYKLIQLDVGLARELEHILQAGGATRLMFDLDTGIKIEESAPAENAPPPDLSAEVMKAQIAAIVEGGTA
jgi:hypothetical protein